MCINALFNDKIYKDIDLGKGKTTKNFETIKQFEWKDLIKFLLFMILISKTWTKIIN